MTNEAKLKLMPMQLPLAPETSAGDGGAGNEPPTGTDTMIASPDFNGVGGTGGIDGIGGRLKLTPEQEKVTIDFRERFEIIPDIRGEEGYIDCKVFRKGTAEVRGYFTAAPTMDPGGKFSFNVADMDPDERKYDGSRHFKEVSEFCMETFMQYMLREDGHPDYADIMPNETSIGGCPRRWPFV